MKPLILIAAHALTPLGSGQLVSDADLANVRGSGIARCMICGDIAIIRYVALWSEMPPVNIVRPVAIALPPSINPRP